MTEERKEKKPLNKNQSAWWDSIKDIEVNYYGLPDQSVKTVCEPLNVVSDVLYLKAQGPAVISLLNEALEENRSTTVKTASGKTICMYTVEPADKFIVLKPNPEVELKDYK